MDAFYHSAQRRTARAQGESDQSDWPIATARTALEPGRLHAQCGRDRARERCVNALPIPRLCPAQNSVPRPKPWHTAVEKAPASKLQTPAKHQTSSSKHGARAFGSLVLVAALELGGW